MIQANEGPTILNTADRVEANGSSATLSPQIGDDRSIRPLSIRYRHPDNQRSELSTLPQLAVPDIKMQSDVESAI